MNAPDQAFRLLPLPGEIAGRLYLSSMPGRYRPFAQDLAEAERLDVTTVLCLNPRDEIEHKSPHYHQALNDGSHGWRVIEHPVEDFRAPVRGDGFTGLVDEVVAELRHGERVMLHCAGGIGRTGTVSSCILVALGLPVDEALAAVRRAKAWPENQAQLDFVRWFAEEVARRNEAAPVRIARAELLAEVSQSLIRELNAELSARYPGEGTTHFRLEPEEVAEGCGAFLVAYAGGHAAGCGAVRLISETEAEIKRMYTVPEARGRGIAKAVLAELEATARGLGARRLVLETGVRQPEAIRVYESAGFYRIPLFGEYVNSSFSICMAKDLV
jgi:GNAT superfamily N-acetyltransferase